MLLIKTEIQINLHYQLLDQLIQKSWDEMEFMQCAAAADIPLLTFVSFLVSSSIFIVIHNRISGVSSV